ncbi:MAG TPA: peptidylprolyl isomerase [Solimonas sp.]|nr:peptidylprolyl isomerase [Solimonas sp.]
MLISTLRKPPLLAWLSVLAGGLLAGAALLLDGWHGGGLPADAVAVVGERPIARADWLQALQSVEGDRGRVLDAAGRAKLLQRLVDEELLFQHALASGLVRDDPGLRKTVIAALVEATTAVDAVDEIAARALFEREPARFGGQPRLRVAGLRVPAQVPAPPRAELGAMLQAGRVIPPLRDLELPDALLGLPQLAQRLGGTAATALRDAKPGELIGPIETGSGALYLLLRERQQILPRYEEVATAVRGELARRQADASLEQLLRELRRDASIHIAPDARP